MDSRSPEATDTARGFLVFVLIGMLFGPMVVFSGYLLLTRGTTVGFTAHSDLTALAVGVCVGLCFVVLLPIDRLRRLAVAVVYVPVAIWVGFSYMLIFVCAVFDNCL